MIAHSLTVSMLHLSGARLALAAGDTDEATAALGDAEAAGRCHDGRDPSHGRPPRERHRRRRAADSERRRPAGSRSTASDRAGLDVRLRLDGSLGTVPLGAGLTAYRLVQESLSNAVKHAPGSPVDLCVSVDEHEMAIRAVNSVVAAVPAVLPAATGCAAWRSGWRCSAGRSRPAMAGARGRSDAHIPWSEPEPA